MARIAAKPRTKAGRVFDLADFSVRDMAECGALLRACGRQAGSLQEVVQELTQFLLHRFCAPGTTDPQCVLVRGFVTQPFSRLDPTERALAEKGLGRSPRSPDMKCLTLMGSSGIQPEWNDRTNSRRYRAIPLVSEQFVGQFPMFSQLLHQFGVKIQPRLRPDSDLLVDWEERTHNVFYVPDAVHSPFVPVQQDFVVRYGVQSVLGFGGVLPSRELCAFVLFSRTRIPAATADFFRTLALGAKLALIPHDLMWDGPEASRADRQGDGVESGGERAVRPRRSRPQAEVSAAALRQSQVEAAVLEELLVVHERTVIADVIQRDLAVTRLDRVRRDYELLLNSVRDGIYGVDREGRATFINPAVTAMLGWTAAELIGRPMHALVSYCHADGRPYPSDESPVAKTLLNGSSHATSDDVFWRRDGTSFPVEYSSTPIREGGRVVGAVVVFRDITERHQAQSHLEDTLERLRTLSQRLQTVREEERARIARELHDELGVALTCLKMDLSQIFTRCEGEFAAQTAEPSSGVRTFVADKVTAMTRQVDDTLAAVQRIVAELRPGVLDDLGLVAAIEWQCRDFERRTGIGCVLSVTAEDIVVEPPRATALFRVCQEALTNVMRHANASVVTVRLWEDDGDIHLRIRDNGKGIPAGKIEDGQSFGLMGMQERMRALDGTLQIDSKPGEGTTILVRVRSEAP
ncbi:MAG: PAS domain-containing sensor histidine kinase [Nitrospiraceae bacterium]